MGGSTTATTSETGQPTIIVGSSQVGSASNLALSPENAINNIPIIQMPPPEMDAIKSQAAAIKILVNIGIS
jgi:hypothetical protein